MAEIMLDYFSKLQTINRFQGPIIEFARPVSSVTLAAYLAKQEIFPRIAETKDIKFLRLTIDREVFVYKETTFSVSVLGGVSVHHLVDLRNSTGAPARQIIVFDADAEINNPKVIIKDASEFGDIARMIVQTSKQLMRLHNGIIPKERWDADVGLQVSDHGIAQHFNMSGEVIAVGEQNMPIKPVRKFDSSVRRQRLDLTAANDSELKAG